MRVTYALFILFFFTIKGVSQSASEKSKPSKLYVSSYAAPAFILGDIKERITGGFQAMTGIEYNFNKRLAIVGELNFDTYNYKESGTTYTIDGSANFIPLTISLRYFLSENRLTPYVRAGGGLARIALPTVKVNNGFTTIGSSSTFVGQIQAAIGINYMLKPQYNFFAEFASQSFGKTDLLRNQNLSLLAVRVGIRTPL
jgi:Outer membrane protein beta-barrel domain